MDTPLITLNSGKTIPQLGFGTYKISPETAADLVCTAIEVGYRHIDTAQMYGNEAEVAEGIRRSGIAREDIFITTKLDNPNHEPEAARRSFAESLEKMKLDYVDLFLIHWPLPMEYGGDFTSTWLTMEEFVKDGRAASIGVSNFEPHHLETLSEKATIVPAVNQIEIHPFFSNAEAVKYSRDHGIAIESWSPLARARLLENEQIDQIAKAHGCTVAQAILAWHLMKGFITIPKTSTRSRMEENLGSLSVTLTAEEMAVIDSLDKGPAGRTGPIPDTMKRAWDD